MGWKPLGGVNGGVQTSRSEPTRISWAVLILLMALAGPAAAQTDTAANAPSAAPPSAAPPSAAPPSAALPSAAPPSATPPSATPPSATALPTAGTFSYTLMPDSSANIKAAIDKTVAHMSFITRPIARGRLGKVNPTPQHVHVRLAADTASVAFDNGNPVVTPLDGATVPWQNPLAHETDHVHAAVAGDTLRQTIAAPDGERENALIFVDGGARLRLHVTVTSHRLPQPLVYELLFRRDSTAGSDVTPPDSSAAR
jgi:hypothetical protein